MKVKVKSLSRVRLFVIPWTVAPSGSFIHGILQARILEWVAISFSREDMALLTLKTKNVSHSVVSNSATPETEAHQAPLSMGFSRQEYWSMLPFPSPEDLSDPGIKPRFPAL